MGYILAMFVGDNVEMKGAGGLTRISIAFIRAAMVGIECFHVLLMRSSHICDNLDLETVREMEVCSCWLVGHWY